MAFWDEQDAPPPPLHSSATPPLVPPPHRPEEIGRGVCFFSGGGLWKITSHMTVDTQHTNIRLHVRLHTHTHTHTVGIEPVYCVCYPSNPKR